MEAECRIRRSRPRENEHSGRDKVNWCFWVLPDKVILSPRTASKLYRASIMQRTSSALICRVAISPTSINPSVALRNIVCVDCMFLGHTVDIIRSGTFAKVGRSWKE